MFLILTKFLLFTQHAPKLIIGLAIVLSLLSIKPILDLNWEMSISSLLPQEHPALALQDSVRKKFGGSQSLIVVVKSGDTAGNAEFSKNFADELRRDPIINLAEYETEASFYREHKFLYIKMQDLDTLHNRIKSLVAKKKEKLNPFIVDLVSDPNNNQNTDSTDLANFVFDDVEAKYAQKLKGFRGSADGTIRVIEIYPAKNNDDLQAMRKFFERVQRVASSVGRSVDNSPEVLYGGGIYDFISNSKTLLSEIRYTAWISAGILFLIFVVACFKIPAISLITALCLGMAMLWTFAATSLLYGRINLFTLLLGIIIPAIGGRNVTHFLSRYTEEMQKGISVKLALESTLLGIVPPFAVSSFLNASMLFCLFALPLQGVKELGITGGLGILFIFFAICTVLPAFLAVMQKKRKFKLFAKENYKLSDFSPKPVKFSKIYISIIILATLTLSLVGGIFPKMEYRFSKTELPKPSASASEILKSIDEFTESPIIVHFANAEYARSAVEKYPQINWVTLESLLPNEQHRKISILGEIKKLLTPEILSKLHGADSLNAQKLIENWNVELIGTEDLPESYQLKFQGKDGSVGEFGFIFPSWNIDDGLQNRRFAHSVGEVKFSDGTGLMTTGAPIIRAALLDLTLPELHKCILLGGFSILLWLLIYQNRRNRIFLLLISPLFGFLWFFGFLNMFGIPLTVYSVFAFPFLIGISIDGSLFLWHRYWEEGTGSLRFVCLQSGRTVAVSYLIPIVAFFGLCFASHPGLRSLGVVSVLGFICILLAHIVIFPVAASMVDGRRYGNRRRNLSDLLTR
ncbi:hypothetical protein AGMMS49938_03750 [Fibrobacterales bacterium]|nr:hypothetical protein AGMMS49938_03750 [Fibrobacterales bacterium]